ncbi:unnamed protein product, partial [marine sediment metagenome]
YLADDIKTPRISTDNQEFEDAEKSVNERLEKLVSINGTQTATSFHKRLGEIMWNHCGMSRNEEGLKKAKQMLKELKEEFWTDLIIPSDLNGVNQELEKAGRVADYFEIADLMVDDALNRTESCGAHYREESQTPEGEALRDDKN